jgi:hypothetical protein
MTNLRKLKEDCSFSKIGTMWENGGFRTSLVEVERNYFKIKLLIISITY